VQSAHVAQAAGSGGRVHVKGRPALLMAPCQWYRFDWYRYHACADALPYVLSATDRCSQGLIRDSNFTAGVGRTLCCTHGTSARTLQEVHEGPVGTQNGNSFCLRSHHGRAVKEV
jgi:hypothetical protein